MIPDGQEDLENNTVCKTSEWAKLPYYNNLTVCCINARSLVSNFSSLITYLSMVKFKFTFIIIVETWLNKNKDVGYEIDGYKSYSIYRENRRGGGIKIYYQENIQVQMVNNFSILSDDIECLFLEASIPSLKRNYIAGLYI